MKTAMIVVNYKEAETTAKYVKMIEHYDSVDRIVVVDNASPTEDGKKLKSLENDKIKVVIAEKNGGYSYGNNVGVKYLEQSEPDTSYDYIIVSNSDIAVEEEAIQKTIAVLIENEEIAVAAPRMYYPNGPARRSSWKERTYLRDIANSARICQLFLFPIFKGGEYSKKEYAKDVLKVDCISGAFFIIKYSVLKEIAYFDENVFLFYEEDILGNQLKEKGYKLASVNTVHFMHYDNQTIGKVYNNIKKKELYHQSRCYYHQTYHHIGKGKTAFLNFLLGVRKIELKIENFLLKKRS